jgi:hypothetical protein
MDFLPDYGQMPWKGRYRPMFKLFSTGPWKYVRKDGEDHLTIVLRLIVETKDNATELWAATITAISELLLAMPWLEQWGGRLYDAFDLIDLAALRRHAKRIRGRHGKVWQEMCTLLKDHFSQPEQGEFFETGWRRAA